MARHNEIFLYGRILKDPIIYYDEEKGIYKRGIFSLVTIQGKRDLGTYIDNLEYQTPTIMSRNPEVVKRMAQWHKNDMIEIKGNITTQEIVKKTKCKHCNETNIIPKANVVYVTPIYADRREENVGESEWRELLKRRCEISNHALVIGNLCRDPKYYCSPKGHSVTQYQLAINRKYFIENSDPLVRTDYPWVRSFGQIAENDAKALYTGSSVLIDGYLQTRPVPRKTVCAHCGQEYEWPDTTAIEIVPYAIEYLKNCNDLEALEREKERQVADMANLILA